MGQSWCALSVSCEVCENSGRTRRCDSITHCLLWNILSPLCRLFIFPVNLKSFFIGIFHRYDIMRVYIVHSKLFTHRYNKRQPMGELF